MSNKTLFKITALTILAGTLLLLIVAFTLAQSSSASPLRFDDTMLPEAELRSLALEHAHNFGLLGEPSLESNTLMAFGSWLTMQGTSMSSETAENFGYTRQTPIYVYQAIGEIPKLRVFGGLGDSSIKYIGVVLALNAQTGEIFGGRLLGEGSDPIDLSEIPIDRGEPTGEPVTTLPPIEATEDIQGPPVILRQQN